MSNKKPSAKDIVRYFLVEKALSTVGDLRDAQYAFQFRVSAFDIEAKVQQFGRERFEKYHNGSTYSRRWRELRQDKNQLRSLGLNIRRSETPSDATHKTWILTAFRDDLQSALNDHPLFGDTDHATNTSAA
jgi:hypothetical protein